jgi:acyl-CoA synthetase (AMP-forming)/AMP-acid ligase II
VLLEWLFERMRGWHDTAAVVWRGQAASYGDLLAAVQSWDTRLETEGIATGRVVALEGDFSPETCALMLALINRRAIVVPLTTAAKAHWTEFLGIAEVEHIIEFDAEGASQVRATGVTATHPLIRKLRDTDAPGLVLFSSGSTGRSKAVLNDFARLLEKFKVPRQSMVTLTFLLFDHIGGVNTLLYTLSNGGTVVTTESRAPEDICRLIEQHRVELLPTTPTFLNLLLLSESHRSRDLSSLRLITYGTEVMPDSTLHRVHETFPGVRLQQTYGLSELGILRTKSRDSGSAWVKVGGEGVETKVVDGTLWVKAPSAMLGYLNAANAVDETGWMNTDDLVDVDGEYVRFLGRKSQIINVGGNKVYPAEVESVLLQMENVADATVYAEANPLTGHIVAARLTLKDPEEIGTVRQRVRAFCRERLAAFKVPVRIELAGDPMVSARFKKIRHP